MTDQERSWPWTIYVCSYCGSAETIHSSPRLGAVACERCSVQWLKEEAPTAEVIPADSLKPVIERLRDEHAQLTYGDLQQIVVLLEPLIQTGESDAT